MNCAEIIRFDQWEAFLASARSGKTRVRRSIDRSGDDPVHLRRRRIPKGPCFTTGGLVNDGAHTARRAGIPDGAAGHHHAAVPHRRLRLLRARAVSQRATQVLVEAFDPGLVIELLETYRANAMLAVPTMLVGMMSIRSLRPPIFRRSGDLFRRLDGDFHRHRLEQRLGAAFTSCSARPNARRPDDWASDTTADKAETIGSPMPNVEVKIVNPDTGQTVPVGEVGEICTRAITSCTANFENQAATAAAIDAEGWLHTGDLGAMDGPGLLTVRAG